jgi:hypothetical protein
MQGMMASLKVSFEELVNERRSQEVKGMVMSKAN